LYEAKTFVFNANFMFSLLTDDVISVCNSCKINLELYVRVRFGKKPHEDKEKGQAADQFGPNVPGQIHNCC
jgi:hypothetical protein